MSQDTLPIFCKNSYNSFLLAEASQITQMPVWIGCITVLKYREEKLHKTTENTTQAILNTSSLAASVNMVCAEHNMFLCGELLPAESMKP